MKRFEEPQVVSYDRAELLVDTAFTGWVTAVG